MTRKEALDREMAEFRLAHLRRALRKLAERRGMLEAAETRFPLGLTARMVGFEKKVA